ncbi:hypothetical protein [Pantoea allii]|uniref:hypothetical protein n=1 Tax=Pantoea allii TaxID=574096 RepID=UPI001F4D41F5|nr:hypothetical protein [Pantoea allii]MCH9299925.1 hypothetical protein [Pantoea allii]
MEGLTRRLQQASKNIDARKLETGEYVRYGEKIVPSAILDEKLAEAAEEATLDTLPVISDEARAGYWPELLADGLLPVRSLFHDIPRTRLAGRKSVTAGLIEAITRHPIQVKAAAPILGSNATPKDGQLFTYDAKSKSFYPVVNDGSARPNKKRPRYTKQRVVMGSLSSKTK